MTIRLWLIVALNLVWAIQAPTHVAEALAEESQDSLLRYSVHIVRTPAQAWPGYGVYLGHGLVLTASHVVGRAEQTKPRVIIGDLDLPSTTVREGSLDTVDLTLLRIDERRLPDNLRAQSLAICDDAPWPGEEVLSATPEQVVRSRVISADSLPPRLRMFDTLIGDVAITGNSGSGLFDLAQKCLLGIMSRKFTRTDVRFIGEWRSDRVDIAKYFVPAKTIKAFIPKELGF